MQDNNKKQIFTLLFAGVCGHVLSTKYRMKMKIRDKEFTYGEIVWDGFEQILDRAPINSKHQVFYDLGSGVGKAVIASALSGKFKKCYGIELLDSLYQASRKVLLEYKQTVATSQEIDFIQADFFEYDFSDADVVFVQCTCMMDYALERLQEKMSILKPGSLVITATNKLKEPFEVVDNGKFEFEWGMSKVYFQIKRG
ncbi:MAG: methyltransferase domain-containing protein [bacterium]